MQDSIEKIVTTYVALTCAEPFTYYDTHFRPRPLKVSPGIFRGFVCPPNCGGCCKAYTLDYLPTEMRPEHDEMPTRPRFIPINGEPVMFFSYLQDDHDNYYCRNLNEENGRCRIHGRHAFSCDFELLRFLEQHANPARPNVLTHKLFGRGWAMKRVDGERGALCYMTEPTRESTSDVLRKLKRLKEWVEYMGVAHKLDPVIAWVAAGPHESSLILSECGAVLQR